MFLMKIKKEGKETQSVLPLKMSDGQYYGRKVFCVQKDL
jgi:hypothetical protein